MEGVAERIQKLIEQLGLNNSSFADSIDLPRPILSHILSGRNKPSLTVIQKIGSTYRNVNLDWLLLGNGDVFEKKNSYIPAEAQQEPIEVERQPDEKVVKMNEVPLPSNNTSEIESIVHNYRNGTFKIFKPI